VLVNQTINVTLRQKKSDCELNERCQDDDGNGIWTCDCQKDYYFDEADKCQLDVCVFDADLNGEYRTVSGKCYYFQTNPLDFVGAVLNCKSKFNGKGKLFEPRSEQINDHVANTARAITPNQPHWIGVRTQQHDEGRHFYYLSEGPTKTTIEYWSAGEPNDFGLKEDCVSVLSFTNLNWADTNCNDFEYSICEIDEGDSCGSPEYATDNFCDDENNKAGCNWDGGACCNNPFDKWNSFCKDCECKDPDARHKIVKCEDESSAKKCKKCKGKKCKKSPCNETCKKTCKLC